MKSSFLHTCRNSLVVLAFVSSLVMATHTTAGAEDAIGGAPGDWLSRYMGARTAGMGGAFVAAADEPLGVIWNPAGLSYMSQNQVTFETARLFESTSMNTLSFGMAGSRFPSFGLTIVNLRSGEFEKTNDLNDNLGEFTEGDMAFLLSASKNINRSLAVGANVKVVRQSIDEFSGAGVGLDLGVMYNITPKIRLGASALNIAGPSVTMRAVDESYPSEFRGGASFMFLGGRGLVSAEVDHQSGGTGTSFRGGSEFWVHRTLGLRVGYAYESPTGGFSYRVGEGWRFDYAASDNELGVMHRVGVSYQFGGFFADSKANPEVFSPIGQHSVTKFSLKSKTKAEAVGWSLSILDKSNQIVRKFGGKGVPPAHVMWDGKDESGLPLSDGIYRYQLIVHDKEGRQFTGHIRTVEITTTGPRGSVPVYTD